jgi:hypothetical protein
MSTDRSATAPTTKASPSNLDDLGRRVLAARQEVEARGETFLKKEK